MVAGRGFEGQQTIGGDADNAAEDRFGAEDKGTEGIRVDKGVPAWQDGIAEAVTLPRVPPGAKPVKDMMLNEIDGVRFAGDAEQRGGFVTQVSGESVLADVDIDANADERENTACIRTWRGLHKDAADFQPAEQDVVGEAEGGGDGVVEGSVDSLGDGDADNEGDLPGIGEGDGRADDGHADVRAARGEPTSAATAPASGLVSGANDGPGGRTCQGFLFRNVLRGSDGLKPVDDEVHGSDAEVERDVEGGRGVGQSANTDEIDTGLGDGTDGFEADATGGFS